MANEQNQWKSGQSGNPSGRPRGASGLSISQDVKRKWAEVDNSDEKKRTFGEVVLEKLFYKAGKEGSVRAAEVLIEHGWGKPLQAVCLDVRGDSQENMETIWEILSRMNQDGDNEGRPN